MTESLSKQIAEAITNHVRYRDARTYSREHGHYARRMFSGVEDAVREIEALIAPRSEGLAAPMRDVREVLGVAPVDPDILRRFGPPTYSEDQVKAYAAALQATQEPQP